MKTPAIQKLQEKLTAGHPVYGLWVSLESASISEMAAALGLDWIVIDAEHGHLDWKDILEHVRATVRSDTVALVRVAESNGGLIKRVLDIGADGVVVPWIESADQLRQAMRFAHYPPEGVRGIGAERATGWGQCIMEHTQEANDHVLVIPIIETVTAGRNIDELGRVAGPNLFFFGPADYSSTAGHRGQWEGPKVSAELLALKNTLRSYGKHCGIMATGPENLIERREQGFRMLGLGSDAGLLLRSLHNVLAVVERDRRILPTLVAEATPQLRAGLERPPESVRPDRPETMNEPGVNAPQELAPGVMMDCMVGSHNRARNFTTGLVTFAPFAQLEYHIHTVSESLTMLSGKAIVAVEGREYTLGPLDNIVIPWGLAHSARNASSSERAVLHVALAADSPTREWVFTTFERHEMESNSTGVPGKERVTRFVGATRTEAGPGTSFIDYFNRSLMPNIEMSGGYGLFQTGGRLPAHFHDFDESICIIQGRATCVVEGRRYPMTDGATALVPRGRVHYFSNGGGEPMAMIWVYAGPLPERVVVDEACATVEGNPWKGPAVKS
jgi:2-keto-3-deoxy-L-rhamnonate aldolase RhmA/quercetin dioxygenase-like cupin family protein